MIQNFVCFEPVALPLAFGLGLHLLDVQQLRPLEQLAFRAILSSENSKTDNIQFHSFNFDTAVAFLKMSMFGLVQIWPMQLQSRAKKKFWQRSQQNFKIKDKA